MACGGLLAQAQPLLSRQEAELLKRAEPLPPAQAVSLIEAELPEEAGAAMLFALGGLYYKAGRMAQARECFLRAAELAPEFGRARLNAAKLMMGDGLEAEAVPHLTKLISSPGGEALHEIWLLLAQCRLAMGENLAAEKAASNAVALKPGQGGAELLLLRAIAAQPGRSQEAASLARSLLKGNPGEGRLWAVWASAELEQGRHDKAMEILEAARCFQAADQEMEETLLELAVSRNYAPLACRLALEMHGRGELPPRLAQATLACLQEDKRVTLARKLLDAAGGILPDGQRKAAERRQAALEGNANDAIRLLREALEQNPLDGEALLELADLPVGKGEAEGLLERALLLPAYRHKALLKMANRAVDEGDYARALQCSLQARQMQDSPELERFVNQVRALLQERNKDGKP